MREFLFTLFFGSDEIASRMFNLLNLRRAAIARNLQNNLLRSELYRGETSLVQITNKYRVEREALELAYRLELD